MTDTPAADKPTPPSTVDRLDPQTLARARAAFTEALPKIRALAHTFHRGLHGDLHDEAVAETEAFAWKAFRDLMARGRDPVPLPGKITEFAAGRARCGTRFAGKVRVRDALSPESRRRHGYSVTSLPQGDDDQVADEVRDALGVRGPSHAEEAIPPVDFEACLDGMNEKLPGGRPGAGPPASTRERSQSKAGSPRGGFSRWPPGWKPTTASSMPARGRGRRCAGVSKTWPGLASL
jgi:hypothetical protein